MKQRNVAADANEAISTYVLGQMPKTVRSAMGRALSNLYSGPGIGNFQRDTATVREWNDDNLEELWYDADAGYVSDTEPRDTEECEECHGDGIRLRSDGLYEDCDACDQRGHFMKDLSEWYHFDLRDVKRAVYGELAGYV